MTDIMTMFPDRIQPEPNSGCWLWTGALGSGRNQYPITRLPSGKAVMMHRLSYSLKKPITPGLQIMHRCDLKWCVNPDHLEEGTNQKNVQDAWRRGRIHKFVGVASPHAKLTADQVAEIRAVQGRFRRGQQAEMAARFGVATVTIRAVRTNRIWKV